MKILANLSIPQQLSSTLPDGTSPFTVASKTLVANFNADLLDGLDASAFALAAHGNHVPTIQAINNAIFLRNDNTWATITPGNIGAMATTHVANGITGFGASGAATTIARSDHTHVKANITDFPTLATVATSGSYTDLSNKPAAYTLPIATATVLGGVKAGSGVAIDATGVISVAGLVSSVAGKTGAVTLVKADITDFPTIPTTTSQLTNNSGYITSSASISGNAATATQTIATVGGTSSIELVRGNMADNDQFRILVGGTATNAGYAEIATADDGTEPIYVRQYTGVFTSLTRTAALLDGSGNTSFPGTVSAASFSGNATSATNASYASRLRRYPENDGYWMSHTWQGNIRGFKMRALNDVGDEQANIHTTSVDYSEYCLHAGHDPAYIQGISLACGAQTNVTHNLGYNPIVVLSGNLGNRILTVNHYSTNVVTICEWDSGNNGWSGNVILY